MEKMNADLSRLLEGKNFKSEDDLKAYLNGMIGKKIPLSILAGFQRKKVYLH